MLKRAICGIGLAALAGIPAHAQRGDGEEPVVTQTDCVPIRRIRSTTVVDDRTILFYMRGGTIYRNFLDIKCFDLGRTKRFSYENRTGQLCAVNAITVFDPFGFGTRAGMTCGLGEFRAITEEEAEFLKTGREAPEERGIEIRTTDLPVEDTSEQSAGEAPEEPAEPAPE